MTTKINLRRNIWKVLITLLLLFVFASTLIACEGVHPEPTVTSAPTFTSLPPTATTQPTNTAEPTETLTPSPTPLPVFKVDGLRFAYIIDGNLYVQDSGGQPAQLTSSGEDWAPQFSDDGQKIIFYRGQLFDPNKVYSINADGSQEQVLVTPDLLANLNLGYDEYVEPYYFIPLAGTHKMFFNTREFIPTGNTDDVNHSGARINSDMLIVDMDSGEIEQLLKPGKSGTFDFSPDQKLDIKYTGDQIDVIDIKGHVVHNNIFTYLPNWYYEWVELSWTQDSNKLILLAPINGNADPTDGPEPNTIWQSKLDESPAREMRLKPPPMDYLFSISPDGNWVVYTYYYYPGKTDRTFPSGVYLGNLRNGNSQLVESGQIYGVPNAFTWSPDSECFIFYNDPHTEMYLGNTQGHIIPIDTNPQRFLGWIDNNRYIYEKNCVVMGVVGQEGSVPVVDLPAAIKNKGIEYFYFTYVYAKP